MNKFLATLKLDLVLAGFPAIMAYLFGVDYVALLPSLCVLITIDWITGITKSIFNKVPITSGGLVGLVTKVIKYFGFLIAVYHVNMFITGDAQPIVQAVAEFAPFYLMLTEFKSILENLNESGMKIPFVKELDNFLSRR